MAKTLRDAVDAIKEEKPFTFGRVHDGVATFSGGPWVAEAFGALPGGWHHQVARARYVVWSYFTPIAWVNQDGTKTAPDVGYSATTAQHQMTTRAAWDLYGRFPARGREVSPAGGGPRRGGIDDL